MLSPSSDNVDFTEARGEATCPTAGLAMGDDNVDFTEERGEATCPNPGLAMGDGNVDITEARGVATCTSLGLAMRDGVQHSSSLLVGKDYNAPGDLIGKQMLANSSKWLL